MDCVALGLRGLENEGETGVSLEEWGPAVEGEFSPGLVVGWSLDGRQPPVGVCQEFWKVTEGDVGGDLGRLEPGGSCDLGKVRHYV